MSVSSCSLPAHSTPRFVRSVTTAATLCLMVNFGDMMYLIFIPIPSQIQFNWNQLKGLNKLHNNQISRVKIDRTSPKDLQVLDNAVVVTVGFSKQIKLHQLSNYQLNMKLSLRKCYNYSQIKRYFSYQFINPQTTIKD